MSELRSFLYNYSVAYFKKMVFFGEGFWRI